METENTYCSIPLWERAWREDSEVKLQLAWHFFAVENAVSTMDVARDFSVKLSGSDPILVIAKNQSHGRGRQGKVWDSTEGAFLGTFVFQGASVGTLSGLSLAVGCAVLRVIHKIMGADLSSLVGLKWPNDVMTPEGKKLAGILVELAGADASTRCLIGVGVNLKRTTTSTQERVALEDLVGASYTPVQFGRLLAAEMEKVWQQFEEVGFSAFLTEWERFTIHRGRKLRVVNGNDVLEGRYLGVSEQGHLLLEHLGEQIACISGSVEQ